jgi:glycogen synthase
MRIGMMSWESLHSLKVGGVAPIVSELAESMALRGNEVHIFTSRKGKNVVGIINGVHYHQIAFDNRGDIVGQMKRWCDSLYEDFQRIQEIFGKFDIVHGHDWHPVQALKQIKDIFHIPCILSMHSTEWGRNGNNFVNSCLFKKIFYREYFGCNEVSKIIVATKRMKEELQYIYLSITRGKN